MTIVSKESFETFINENCSLSMRSEPRRERDGEYSYDCYDNADGDEIAFVSYKTGEEPSYSIAD